MTGGESDQELDNCEIIMLKNTFLGEDVKEKGNKIYTHINLHSNSH